MRPRFFLLCSAFVIGGCATLRGSSHPRLGGTYAARLAVTGRSTYTGSLTAEWVGDSLRGGLKLTAPLTVDMALRGAQSGDTLRIRGTYSASNGCTGTFEAAVASATDVAGRGPFTLNDRCAGLLPGVLELRR
jgi:hypothetical protein